VKLFKIKELILEKKLAHWMWPVDRGAYMVHEDA
jgi:hypothetical protein